MDNLSIEEKYEQVLIALAADSCETFEDVLLMARGQYFGLCEQHHTMELTIADLLEALIAALPYVETAELDEAYKPRAVAKIVSQMKAAIAKADGKEAENV